MGFKEAVKWFFVGIVIVALALAFLGVNGKTADTIINWLIPIGISFILSGLVGDILEAFTGDFFKDIYLSFPVWIFRVNIPLFVILTFLIKLWWFG